MTDFSRQPKGQPTGGQFAAVDRPDCDTSLTQPVPREWQPDVDKDVIIAAETEPWLQRDNGEEIDLTEYDLDTLLPQLNDCDGCAGTGVFAPVNTNHGINRCDQCQAFPGDLEAAAAVAQVIGGHVYFEPDA